MIIALFALALAMIAGGLLAVFLGWDIILVERGWTMVIAGSIAAASGALLLGITAAVSRLSRIQTELARLKDGLTAVAPAAPPASTDLSLAALSGGLLSRSASGKAGTTQDQEAEAFPHFTDEDKEVSGPLQAAPPAKAAPSRAENVREPKVPEFLLGDRLRETHADASPYASEPEPDEEERGAGVERGKVVKPAAWPGAQAAPAEQGAAPGEPEESHPPAVVGTYNSGDNKYIMFSDGSIEAQTPGGVFHFHSLDELKEFIASGGEKPSGST